MRVPSGEIAIAESRRLRRCGRYIAKRVTGLGAAGLRDHTVKPTRKLVPKAAADHSAVFSQFFLREAAGTAAKAARVVLSSAIHFNSSQRSLAVCQRFSGSFARHLLTTRSSAGGVIGCSEEIG